MKTLGRLLALFLIAPAVELALLVQVDKLIGFWPTIGLILFTGLLGGFLAKREGLSVWRRFQEQLQAGGLPGQELLDGVIILIAGALLITPGVLSDVLGILGMIPATRAVVRKIAMKRIQRTMQKGSLNVMSFDGWSDDAYSSPAYDPDPPPHWQGSAHEVPRHADGPNRPTS